MSARNLKATPPRQIPNKPRQRLMRKGKTLSSVVRDEMKSPTFRRHYERRLARFPEECPVFEVLSTAYYEALKPGDLVEGFLYDDGCIRVLSPRGGNTFGLKNELYGWATCSCGLECPRAVLRPLTPAAREMLALVRR